MIVDDFEEPVITRSMRRSWMSFGISCVWHLILFLMLTVVVYTVNDPGLIVLDAESMSQTEDLSTESPSIDLESPLEDLNVQEEALLEQLPSELDQPLEPTVDWSSMLAAAPEMGNGDMAEMLREADTGGFFGIEATGGKIVYIIDMSPSMNQGYPQRRFDRAVDEVLSSVNQLRDDQKFYVYLFCFESRPMAIGDEDEFLYPTAENKVALETWLRGVELGPGTDPREALVAALKMRPSCVFLLSDGEFNGKKYGTGRYGRGASAVSLARRYNKSNCPIHTIGLEDEGSQEDMTQIAEDSEGRYKFIPALGDDGL